MADVQVVAEAPPIILSEFAVTLDVQATLEAPGLTCCEEAVT